MYSTYLAPNALMERALMDLAFPQPPKNTAAPLPTSLHTLSACARTGAMTRTERCVTAPVTYAYTAIELSEPLVPRPPPTPVVKGHASNAAVCC